MWIATSVSYMKILSIWIAMWIAISTIDSREIQLYFIQPW